MRTAVRLAGFGAGLALVFALAWAAGTVTGPPPATGSAPASAMSTATAGHDDGGDTPDEAGVDSAGLVATAAGYTLVPRTTTFVPGTPAEFGFTVTGSDGRPVTAYDVEHEKQLHLIVVRRDAAGFQHLHPVLGPDGVWRVPLVLPAAGVWRGCPRLVPAHRPPPGRGPRPPPPPGGPPPPLRAAPGGPGGRRPRPAGGAP